MMGAVGAAMVGQVAQNGHRVTTNAIN